MQSLDLGGAFFPEVVTNGYQNDGRFLPLKVPAFTSGIPTRLRALRAPNVDNPPTTYDSRVTC